MTSLDLTRRASQQALWALPVRWQEACFIDNAGQIALLNAVAAPPALVEWLATRSARAQLSLLP